ncbi:hypothetical protein, partial [Salmonella enterica]|uniref:hypothetical protein n=1 Tax=Salmonella enterica TaxID=28901 RepID=UPI003296E7B9
MTSKQIGFFTKNITLWIQVAIKANLCILGTALGPFCSTKSGESTKRKKNFGKKLDNFRMKLENF